WIEGRVAFQRGEWDEAETRLAAVQGFWVAEGRLGEASLATLDLVRAAAEQERFEAIPKAVDGLAAGFRGLPELPIALQALCSFEEEALAPGAHLAASARAAARFLRQTLRGLGFRVQPP